MQPISGFHPINHFQHFSNVLDLVQVIPKKDNYTANELNNFCVQLTASSITTH